MQIPCNTSRPVGKFEKHIEKKGSRCFVSNAIEVQYNLDQELKKVRDSVQRVVLM